ncbi:unnamed protein product [Didymodactylos carnosus]|uniref:BAH domain-containing protein n=1 Tax=Didymodactylos carnosus TaxID=1234261 RepID=A0A813Q422_9BILA|nr:unnamed protein product [Didymodactylos carnosus]CAF0898557.1 unnamed protein product [Didymodactylos carnosus]CAF3542673.1 unnamed protein product [Didymodactylos carnosus]CAF3679708.1 unnamed protein product [Didymodactylos carnosus]
MDPKEDEQSLEERLRAQNKNRTKKNNTFKDDKICSHTDANGILYKIGDHVYLETNKQNQPYAIGCILDFRVTRKDNVMLEVKWYFRPNELPDTVYALLMQDRSNEFSM